MSSTVGTVSYSERLAVPLRWWVQGTMLVASLWLALVVAVPAPVSWLITAVAMLLLSAALISFGSARISVHDGVLRAGRASIAATHLGPAVALDADATRRTAGRDADVRAFLLLRPYLKRSVKIVIQDPADPAPYWLVSSRHPERLVAALDELTRASPRRSDTAPG